MVAEVVNVAMRKAAVVVKTKVMMEMDVNLETDMYLAICDGNFKADLWKYKWK